MAKKIYFSPSDQTRNTYAVGDTHEAAECRQIALYAVKAAQRCGFEAMTDAVSGGDAAMDKRINESNAWGADVHMPIHTNAFNTEVMGTRLFCSSIPGTGYDICKVVMAALAPITPGESDSIKTARFAEIVRADAPTVYVEVAFHDNPVEAAWIDDHNKEIAEALVKGLCDYYGMEYILPNEKKEETIMYNTIEEVPEYAKATIQKLMDKGALQGKANGDLALSEDMLRIMVIHDRMGLYGI